MAKITSSRMKQNQRIVQLYKDEHHVDTVNLEDVAAWAVRTGRWHRKQPTLERLCKHDLSQALRVQTYTDPQGREVRVMHSFPTEQGVLWEGIHTITPGNMRISMQTRRNAILADCRRHKIDFDSYNENNKYGTQLTLFDYNFNHDLEELEFPTDYPDARPDDDEDEDESE